NRGDGMRGVLMVGLAATTCCLVACQSPIGSYEAPTNIANAASIGGTDSSDRKVSARVFEIDGHAIAVKSREANERLPLAPGKHDIKVIAQQNPLTVIGMANVATFTLLAEPDKSYTIRAADPAVTNPQCENLSVWIETADGATIGEHRSLLLVA